MADASHRAKRVRQQLPVDGLFAGHSWRISPGSFSLGPQLAREIETLGRVLLQFYRAVNLLYRKSVEGKQPEWVAQWLDLGKPADLIALQRSPAFKNEVPRVIRPDLLLTEGGLSVTELDSVPGGIGLTAWLNRVYSELGDPVLGGPMGMLDGFSSIFGSAPRVHVVVSREAATYRPEMDWVAAQLGGDMTLRDDSYLAFGEGEAVYRFFELFDVANVPSASTIFRLAESKRIQLTPPPKPVFEEKLLFALLWNRNLASFWRQELGQSFFQRLQRLAPYTWLVDPTPLPPHAAIPELGITRWEQLAEFSQRERDLILKVSGFSPDAWGARGVHLGSDLPQGEWAAAVHAAIRDFHKSPSVLQRYHKPALTNSHWYDFKHDQLVRMHGRVRLCPYYFVAGDGDSARAQLGGVLATICPAEKKIIHGMTEAILAPCTA